MPTKSHSTREKRYIHLPSKPPRQLKDWEALHEDITNAFLLNIRRVQQYAKESTASSHDSVYTGISGIALMEYHVATLKLPLQNEILTPKVLCSVADRNLAKCLRSNPINVEYMYTPSRLSFIETPVGIATLTLVRGLSTAEQVILDNWVPARSFLEYTLERTLAADNADYSPGDKEDGCELLYGRAGLMYALLYLRKATKDCSARQKAAFNNLLSDDVLRRLIDSIVARGKDGGHFLSTEFRTGDAESLPPLMWTWHGRRYLGDAHGISGILKMLLSCPITMIQKHLPDIFKTISWLVDTQDETGNWPTKCPNQSGSSVDHDLVQWCHGAPGMCILLSRAMLVYQRHKALIPQSTVDDATLYKIYKSLNLAARLVYKQGLLRKGVGLCHGVSGNVYALLAASDVLDGSSSSPRSSLDHPDSAIHFSLPEEEDGLNAGPRRRTYFTKAAHLAFLGRFFDDPSVVGPEMETADNPMSLYEGLGGMCCAWAEILSRMDERNPRRDRSGMPGFDDL